MAKIEGFRVKNFKVLKNVTLGRLWNQQQKQSLTPMTAVIGKNGVGKSVLFDAFGFLADALKFGVEEACDARGRSGFEKIRTQGETGPIEFEIYYRERRNDRPITYEIDIAADESGCPYVLRERLRQRQQGQRYGRPFSFLLLNNGTGMAWTRNRLLLDQLPRLLRGYGNTFANSPANYPAAVILVCDLDNRCLKVFREELFTALDACNPKPETRFCIAIEEDEAWLLGDLPTIKLAYPNAKDNILNRYDNDSICGTWELLADAVFQGGLSALRKRGG